MMGFHMEGHFQVTELAGVCQVHQERFHPVDCSGGSHPGFSIRGPSFELSMRMSLRMRRRETKETIPHPRTTNISNPAPAINRILNDFKYF
jgi:hypothetical protein